MRIVLGVRTRGIPFAQRAGIRVDLEEATDRVTRYEPALSRTAKRSSAGCHYGTTGGLWDSHRRALSFLGTTTYPLAKVLST